MFECTNELKAGPDPDGPYGVHASTPSQNDR